MSANDEKVEKVVVDQKNSETPAATPNSKAKASKKPRGYKSRLILGDGNFSYSCALLTKHAGEHPILGSSIVVTEFNSEDMLNRTYTSSTLLNPPQFRNFADNVKSVKAFGAETSFNVDATNISNSFKKRRFKRVHFNFPYCNDARKSVTQNKADTCNMVNEFFRSASQHQEVGDRIHMALSLGAVPDKVWYESATYGIAQAIDSNRYRYIAKRNFIDNKSTRYPGYFHVKTNENVVVQAAENGREFIFEKLDPIDITSPPSSEKKTTKYHVPAKVLIDLSTDEESSSYYDSSATAETGVGSDQEEVDVLSTLTSKLGLKDKKAPPSSAKKAEDPNHWYDDVIVDQLLLHYFPGPTILVIATALPVELNTAYNATMTLISHRLLAIVANREAADHTPIYLPLRIGGNHWIGLYVDPKSDDPVVCWIDPYGYELVEIVALLTMLNGSHIFNVEISAEHVRVLEGCLQTDGFNCGPWIVEIIRFFMSSDPKRLPTIDDKIDIASARQQHREIMLAMAPVNAFDDAEQDDAAEDADDESA